MSQGIPILARTIGFKNQKNLFDKFDKDRDGKITAEELLQVLGRLHEGTRAELPLAKVKEMIAKYDLNGDGCIDVEEFIEMMLEEPVRKIISQKAMKSLENQAMVMVGLGLLMCLVQASTNRQDAGCLVVCYSFAVETPRASVAWAAAPPALLVALLDTAPHPLQRSSMGLAPPPTPYCRYCG